MIVPLPIKLVLCATLLVGLGAGYLLWRGHGDWGLVRQAPWAHFPHHEVWVTGKAPSSVQAAALIGILLCPVYVHAALIGGFTIGACILGTRSGQIAPGSGMGALALRASPLALLVMGLAGAIGLVAASRALLRRDPNASALARSIAIFHICLGGVLGGLGVLAVAIDKHSWFLILYIATLCIGPLLAAHGLLLLHAASALHRYDAAQAQRRT